MPVHDSKIYGVVYRIICKTSGKCYHGQTVNPKERRAHHARKDSHCWALRNAILKYGRADFVFEIVETAATKEELDAREKFWVRTSLTPLGYNLREGGANGLPSRETREKLSVSVRRAQARPEVRQRISDGLKEAWKRPGYRARMSEIRKAVSPETRQAKSAAMRQMHQCSKQKERRSAALCRKWAAYSPEERAARIAGAKGLVYRGTSRAHATDV